MKVQLIDHGYKALSLYPQRAHYNDSGADILAPEDITLPAGQITPVNTLIGMHIPDGFDIVIHCKSGLSKRGILAINSPVDAGYKGPIHAILFNTTQQDIEIKQGEKIGQFVMRPVLYPEFVESLGEERGEGNFGSTGK